MYIIFLDAFDVCVNFENKKTVETKNKKNIVLKNIITADNSGVEVWNTTYNLYNNFHL